VPLKVAIVFTVSLFPILSIPSFILFSILAIHFLFLISVPSLPLNLILYFFFLAISFSFLPSVHSSSTQFAALSSSPVNIKNDVNTKFDEIRSSGVSLMTCTASTMGTSLLHRQLVSRILCHHSDVTIFCSERSIFARYRYLHPGRKSKRPCEGPVFLQGTSGAIKIAAVCSSTEGDLPCGMEFF
jgi:hypothetical protein